MVKVEIKIARGKTAEELTEDATRIANLRDKEIWEAVDKGFDIVDQERMWFKPCGSVSMIKGEWVMPMRRMI